MSPMPPIPPMPPPPPPIGLSSLGSSATIASVVSIRLATEAAFCSAKRVTLVGSTTPIATRSPYSPVAALKPKLPLHLDHLVDDHRRLVARVLDDLTHRLLERAQHDLDAGFLVRVVALQVLQVGASTQVGDPAACNDAFLDGGTRGVQRVFDASLLFLHLDFGRGADLDHRNAAGELGHALLQLFLVVVRGRLVDLHANVLHARPRSRTSHPYRR